MKISTEHFNSLKQAIKTALDRDAIPIEHWLIKYQDKSETRMLWDLYWLSGWSNTNREASNLYNDSHIQTALKRCVKEMTTV